MLRNADEKHRTFADAVSDDVLQTVHLGCVLEHDEVPTDRITGGSSQLIHAQILPDTDCDHRYSSVARPRCSRSRLVQHARVAGGEQNSHPLDLPGTVGVREPAESHLSDGFVDADVACCFLRDVVDCLQNVLRGRVSVQVKLAPDVPTVDANEHNPTPAGLFHDTHTHADTVGLCYLTFNSKVHHTPWGSV